MARIPIETVAIPGPVSPGRRIVEIQRPGPGARLDFNPHSGFAPGFVHGYYPGRSAQRTGRESPELAAMREAALAAGADPLLVEELDLDDLIVTPEFIEAKVGGISFRTTVPARTMRGQPLVADQYIPTGDFDTVSLANTTGWLDAHRSFSSASVSAPIYIREISWTATGTSNSERAVLSCEGVGRVFEYSGPLITAGLDASSVHPNKLIPSGMVQMVLDIENSNPGVSMGDSFSALMIYERARRK